MQKNINRSKDDLENRALYYYFKEDELARLTDDEFEILRAKVKVTNTSAPVSSAFSKFCDGFGGKRAEGLCGDETTLNIYRKATAAHPFFFNCFQAYSRAFAFALKLGVRNIYDIGCGNQLQAFLLMYAPEISYTGIDPLIFEDNIAGVSAEPEYINDMFERFAGGRITHIKAKYPCDLAIAENNTAIFFNLMVNSPDEEQVKDMGAAFSRDFDRVMLTVSCMEFNPTGTSAADFVYGDAELWGSSFERYYRMWKNAMPDFEFYKIGEPNYVFATKVAADKEKLRDRYTIDGDRVLTGVIETPWYTLLMNERK